MSLYDQLITYNTAVQSKSYLPLWVRSDAQALVDSFFGSESSGERTDSCLGGRYYDGVTEKLPTGKMAAPWRGFLVFGSGALAFKALDGSTITMPVTASPDSTFNLPVRVTEILPGWSAYPVLALW